MSRFVSAAVVVGLALPGCGLGDAELPDTDSWQPPSSTGNGAAFYLVVDYVVGSGFDPAFIEVWIDGASVVSGVGRDRPDEHCNWYGPYELDLEPGDHRLEATTDTGLNIDAEFDLSSDSMGLVRYVDPSYGGYDDIPEPHLAWDYIPDQGFLGCA